MFSSSYPNAYSSYATVDVREEGGGECESAAAAAATRGSSAVHWEGHHHVTSAVAPSPPIPLGKQNARSFLHSSYRGHDTDYGASPYCSSFGVRQQTAELANRAVSDVASSVHSDTPPRHEVSASSNRTFDESSFGRFPQPWNVDASGSENRRDNNSYLTHLLRKSTPEPCERRPVHPQEDALQVAAVPNERNPLIARDAAKNYAQHAAPDGFADIEGQSRWERDRTSVVGNMIGWSARGYTHKTTKGLNIKGLTPQKVWKNGVVKPASYLPAVVLGLLLNVLDGLSYGMILFPLGQDVFSDLGPDGLSMFYVSCIVSQLVYSCGGSKFKGGIGSEMIEVVPFFHKMAFTILHEIGPDNRESVLATTILSYALSSILTGAVFFLLGSLKLGSLVGFFPRHILVGCIGGVGWFLVATGLEVSARLDGNLKYNYETFRLLFEPSTVPLWTVPLFLAIFLIICQRFIKHTLLVPLYFMAIPAVFYIVIAAIPRLNLPMLRHRGWVFDAPAAGVPFWHFYTLYDFGQVDWKVLFQTVPAMFALTFFGILHVPINVPALGVSTGEDNVDVDRELIAHGVSNALSGFAGSIQNYLVYTNSILFIRSGGDSRVAGVMLAAGTLGIMAMGPTVIGYIPVMVVGALIFLLGIELLKEALYDTWGKLSRLEYLTISIIVVTMGIWDFVVGILIGIVMACLSLVVSTSQKSPIRATYSGAVARSTVRRPPIQQHFLREVGRQTQVVKLAGYMFFGTIASVERRVRGMLQDQTFHKEPVLYLIIDFQHVTGIDFSAAEAFTRMQRLLSTRRVQMILSGVNLASEIGHALRGVGLWSESDDKIMVFEDLNSALESCENEYLTALYCHRGNSLGQQSSGNPRYLDVPPSKSLGALSLEGVHGSPRRTFLHEAAATTLQREEVVHPSKWQNFRRPLPLILQIFQEMTDKNEDFWFRALPAFEERIYPSGAFLFHRGDKALEFYLIEEGILRADYDLDQGKYSESIVAGTTCGELPFFSETMRTASVVAEKDTTTWVMDETRWKDLQKNHPDVALELLRISMKLTSERMIAITSYVLTIAG